MIWQLVAGATVAFDGREIKRAFHGPIIPRPSPAAVCYDAIFKPVMDLDETLQERDRPKLLIIGHARHGKDTLAKKIRDKLGFRFTSSSVFVGKECIWPEWGKERYNSFEEMFADRVNHRATWASLISAYNTPDKTKTAKIMIARGFDMYVGMRRMDEFTACRQAKLFDCVIWVDAIKRLPPEGRESMELTAACADLYCDNNGPEEAMDLFVDSFRHRLALGGALIQGD